MLKSLKQKLASEQRTSSVRCKVMERDWAWKYITVFWRGKQNAAVKWSPMATSLDGHPLRRTSATPAGFALQHCAGSWLQKIKRKKQLASVAQIESLRIRFFHGATCQLFPTKAGPAMFTRFCQLPWLHRWIDHVLLVEHCTLQKNSVTCHYVSKRES